MTQAALEQTTAFHLAVPQAELDDLRQRLALTRWPDRETVTDASQGPQLAKVQTLVEHWADGYDWRPTEALLNGLGQHVTTIDGLEIHFLHVRSAEPDALPMIMTHGWPGRSWSSARSSVRWSTPSPTAAKPATPSTWSSPACPASASPVAPPPPAGASNAPPAHGWP